jgi:hypothetical protein
LARINLVAESRKVTDVAEDLGLSPQMVDARHLDQNPCLFLGLTDGALRDGLADVLLPHGQRPLAGVAAALQRS